MNALIIDDEAASRLMVRQYLDHHSQITIKAECRNGLEAIDAIDLYNPDLIFLDIQMPGATGFELLEKLQNVPRVIFITAHEQYALNAFDANAIDYLLKPITRQRFDQAINKLLQHTGLSETKLEAGTAASEKYRENILVLQGKKFVKVKLKDVLYLKAEKDFSRIVTATDQYISSFGISILEQKLDPQFFCRIHRSYIINLNAIKELHRDKAGSYVVLSDNTSISIGRSFFDNIRNMIY